jgi:tetratricopeptide (TPR) repeat protein
LVLLTTRDAVGELAAWCPTDPVALGGLDEAGARELLGSAGRADMLDAEPEATEQLLDVCDSVPAFLRRAGNTLHLRRSEFRPVARLVSELRAGHDPRGFEGVLTGIGLNTLPRAAKADLSLLSIHPGETFTRDSADALLGRSASATIDTLQAAGLAVGGAGGHLRLLRLVRQRVSPAPAAAEAALHRLIAVVTEHAVAADVTLEGDRLRPAVVPADLQWRLPHLTAIEYLDLHATLIVELVEIAHHQERHESAIRLCAALEVVLTYLGRHHLIATAITWGIKSAQARGDATATARLYAIQGRIETELSLFDKAATSIDAAEQAAANVGNPRLDSSLLEFRARLARERARRAIDDGRPDTGNAFTEAAELIRRSLEIDRTHDLRRARGIHARELGNLMVRAQRPDEAMLLFDEATRYTEATQTRNLSRIHLGRARAHDLLERWPEVDREVASARELAAASGAVTYDVEIDDFTAETAWHRGDAETARTQWDRLAQKFYAMGHPRYDRYKEKLRRLPPVRP